MEGRRSRIRAFSWRAAVLSASLLLAAAPASAKTCTRELSEKEFAGSDIVEMICGNVAVRLLSLRSEMFYRRWTGEIAVRAIKDGGLAKVALAAFDAPGDLIGTATLYDRKIEEKPKTISF